MKIIEKFIKGKAADQTLCEDRLLVTESFIAVVDGVTSKSTRSFDGKTGGVAAAEAVYDEICKFPCDITVENATRRLTRAVASLYEKGEEKGCAAAGVIILSLSRNEIWSIGDCQCIINGEKHLHEKEIDILLSQKRAEILEEAIESGVTEAQLLESDIGREEILPTLKEQHRYANTIGELGFAVINGTPVPEEMIVTYSVKKGDTIILASDGYPFLCDTLYESERLLEKELSENPLCYKNYKSTKGIKEDNLSFDDRTYIKIEI